MSIYVTVYIEIYVYTYIIYILDFGEFKTGFRVLKDICVFNWIGFLLLSLLDVCSTRENYFYTGCLCLGSTKI